METNDLDAKQQAAAERWVKGRKESPLSNKQTREHDHAPDMKEDRRPGRTRGGPEEEL
jgi:hypothetical protein